MSVKKHEKVFYFLWKEVLVYLKKTLNCFLVLYSEKEKWKRASYIQDKSPAENESRLAGLKEGKSSMDKVTKVTYKPKRTVITTLSNSPRVYASWEQYYVLRNLLVGIRQRGIKGWNSIFKLSLLLPLLILIFLGSTGGTVFAAQTNESAGPGSVGGAGGYGWQQVFSDTGTVSYARLTGSADRENYSWGYKNIQIYVREEDYWAQDCGWWYVGGGNKTGVRIVDAAGDEVWGSYGMTPTQGRNMVTYNWGADDDPGRWTVYVNDTAGNWAIFYLYVKGQLNLTSISTNSTPTTGSPVWIFANISDNAGNVVKGNYVDNAANNVPPTVTLHVSGSGELFQDIAMSDTDNDAEWVGVFTPQNLGDHMVTVKASDGNQYWVDGRNSTVISVTGSFPMASLGLPVLLRIFGSMPKRIDLSFLTVVAIIGLAVVKRRKAW